MTEDQLENSKQLGELLANARKGRALSQKEIASRLNLREETISALDANDFDKLPDPAYVMGYIRNYARAVGLNADTLISIYVGMTVNEAPQEILSDDKPIVVQAGIKNKFVQIMTLLVTFSLAILLFIWWQDQRLAGTALSYTGARTSEGGKYPGGFTYTYQIVAHPETHAVVETDAPENNDLKKLQTTATIEDSQDLITSQTNSDTLKMELTTESWIEVYDALGKKLYFDLAKPREKIRLTGTAPFSVTLGNARAVSVNFNGKPFDTGKYTKFAVANFLLE